MRRPAVSICPSCRFENAAVREVLRRLRRAIERCRRTSGDPAAPESYTPKPLAERILRSRGALEGERKQVTVLFADIKGSMELIQGADPEDARRILDPTIEAMMRCRAPLRRHRQQGIGRRHHGAVRRADSA